MKKLLALAAPLALAALLSPSLASAQPKAPRGQAGQAAQVEQKGKDLTYKFGDDDLLGGTIAAGTATITVRPKAARATLIQPRLSFVPEMLKSAEAL